MCEKRKVLPEIAEIAWFALVGSLAFLVDFFLLNLAVEHGWKVYPATALGFLAGVALNYRKRAGEPRNSFRG